MILTGLEIISKVRQARVRITPFHSRNVTTNSCDLTLGAKFIELIDDVSDVRKPPNYHETTYRTGEIVHIPRGGFLLGHSAEKVGSDYYVPIIHAKSGVARLGLFVHVTADLIDIGSYGQITFQLFATRPVDIVVGMKIAQVSFWKPMGDIILYDGKYQGSEGPQPSMISSDFKL